MPDRFVYSKKTAKAFIRAYVQNNAIFSSEYIKRGDVDGIVLEDYDKYVQWNINHDLYYLLSCFAISVLE